MPFIDLDHRLEYEWLGPEPGAGKVIVMLHHGFGSVSAWRELPSAVAGRTGLPVLVYSRRGCGRSARLAASPRPVDFMSGEAHGDLHRLVNVLGVRDPILLGHSDGASIALIYASSGLEPKPAGLVLIAPHVFVEAETVAGAEAAREAYESGELREKLARHHDDPDGAFFAWNKTWLLPRFWRWDIRPGLRNVSCPVTVIQGEDDEYGTRRQIDALISGLKDEPDVALLPGCGHMLYRENEQELLTVIANHVNRLARGS